MKRKSKTYKRVLIIDVASVVYAGVEITHYMAPYTEAELREACATYLSSTL